MHLIGPLASGVNGAESGTAFLYRRGTSTLVAYYTDFEATAASTQSASGIALDANGSVVVYVDMMVRVVVKDANGLVVRTFVAGDKDSAVEVMSTGFTGTDYVTGATGSGEPTTLQSVLNKWYTTSGTTDFNVLVGGVSTPLKTAVQGLSGVYFNVKSASYGATGDGTTDDYAACAAAITAAAVLGGIVVFPPGTYRITDTLAVPVNVSIMGCGPRVTEIKSDSAGSVDSAFHFPGTTSTSYRFQKITDLRITSAQANTFGAVTFTSAYLWMENVEFVGSATGWSDVLVVGTGSPTLYHVIAEKCFFLPVAGAISFTQCIAAISAATSGVLEVNNCTVKTQGTTYAQYAFSTAGTTSRLKVSNTTIDVSAATSTCTGTAFYSVGDMIITGCYMKGPSSGTAYMMDMSGIATSGGIARESGNVCDGAGVGLYILTSAAVMDQMRLESRTFNYLATTTTAATLTLSPLLYGSELVEKTNSGGITLNATTAAIPIGHKYTLTFWNNGSGGSITVTLGTGFKGTNLTVADNKLQTAEFVSRAGPSGTIYLYQIGTPRDESE